MKEEFFSKFKDYNKNLEKILEKKDFSKDAKNLLLSMFYKLEMSYNDYLLVKRNCRTKQEYLESILENIKNCNKIETVKPNDNDFEILKEEKSYMIDLKLKKIKVIANEISLLSSILELSNFEIHLNEQYNLIRNSMPYLLNMAYDMENIEVIRDFNAWSWNTLVQEINNININLVFQNLRIALNFDLFTKIKDEPGYNDVIKEIKENLKTKYNENDVEKFLYLIFKISILIFINKSENEKKRLLEEKENIEIELIEIKNKKLYIENVTKQKKDLNKELKNIDLTLNNKELLIQEYERRNNSLSNYNKIFSISHLAERLQKEREKILEKIDLCNENIQPQNYIKNKNKLQKDYDLLKDIDKISEKNLYKYIDELQKIFIEKIFMQKIENSNTREEIIKCMYEIRYYNFIPYTHEKTINEIEKFILGIEDLEVKIIKKMYDNKIINTLSSNEKNDIEILKNIFNLKIINMEYIYIELNKKENYYLINIYDEKETIEKSFKMQLEFNKKDKIKLNKRIKLFL